MLTAPMLLRRRPRLIGVTPDTGLTPANTTVSTPAALTIALNAVPSNTGATYIIDVLAGAYGDFTFPSSYSRGTTTVEVRGAVWNDLPVFDSIAATSSNRVRLNRIRVTNPTRDRFGFPTGGPNGSSHINFGSSQNCHLRDVRGLYGFAGLNLSDTTNTLVEYSAIEGFGMDGIRMYTSAGAGNKVSGLTIRKCYVCPSVAPGTFPALAMHTGYSTDGSCGIDPRRSDAYGYSATADVIDLDGIAVSVTAAQKDSRHPDLAQANGLMENVLFEDCHFRGWNGYCQLLLLLCEDAYANGGELTNVVVNRCLLEGADVHGVWWRRAGSGCAVRNTVLRNLPTRTWALNTPSGSSADLMRTTIATAPNASWTDVEITNSVMPTDYSSTWYDASAATVSGLSFSNTETPTGWADWAVAKGDYGQFGWYTSTL